MKMDTKTDFNEMKRSELLEVITTDLPRSTQYNGRPLCSNVYSKPSWSCTFDQLYFLNNCSQLFCFEMFILLTIDVLVSISSIYNNHNI